jgi:hypothetical protein
MSDQTYFGHFTHLVANDIFAHHAEIRFVADDPADAVESALRWYRSRHEAFPSLYGVLRGIKVHECGYDRISENGRLVSQLGFPFFDWKLDWGYPVETKIGPLREKFGPKKHSMKLDEARQAARLIGAVLAERGTDAGRDPEGKSLEHAAFMAGEIGDGPMEEGAAMRWLGYLQAMLVFHGVSTLENERDRNRPKPVD